MFVWLFGKEAASMEEYIAALEKMYELDANEYIGGS